MTSNLSDLTDAATAKSNLGLGTAATHAAGDFMAGVTGNKPRKGRPAGFFSVTADDVHVGHSERGVEFADALAPGDGAGRVPGKDTRATEPGGFLPAVEFRPPTRSARSLAPNLRFRSGLPISLSRFFAPVPLRGTHRFARPAPNLAEEEGFEPPVSSRPRLISSQVP